MRIPPATAATRMRFHGTAVPPERQSRKPAETVVSRGARALRAREEVHTMAFNIVIVETNEEVLNHGAA
ncbi:hypothetical protein ACGFIG_25160 [Micromonospora sp. NPDC049048]|uniref:hypothetical protein n=1 Tax=Micromonospora sp. NPDC049048 TaxID=3364263 RepID=UPI003717EBC5